MHDHPCHQPTKLGAPHDKFIGDSRASDGKYERVHVTPNETEISNGGVSDKHNELISRWAVSFGVNV